MARDPHGILHEAAEYARKQDDATLILRLRLSIERLRNVLHQVAPEANITDRFEGLEAAAIVQVLEERHG